MKIAIIGEFNKDFRPHFYFSATLFVPPDNSTFEKPHPLVLAFIQSVLARIDKNKPLLQ